VLRAWPALSRHIESAKLYRRVLTECSAQLPGWKEKRCAPLWRRARADDELLRGMELAEARRVRRLFGGELDGDTRAFIDASDRLDRRRSWLSTVIAVWAVAMAVFAAWGWIESAKHRTASVRATAQIIDSIAEEIRKSKPNFAQMPSDAVRRILFTYAESVARLVATAPDDLGLKYSQEIMLREFGEAYEAAGFPIAAREAYEKSLAIAQELARRDPAMRPGRKTSRSFRRSCARSKVDGRAHLAPCMSAPGMIEQKENNGIATRYPADHLWKTRRARAGAAFGPRAGAGTRLG